MLALLLVLIFMKSCSSSHSDTRIVGYLPSWYYQCYHDVDFADLTHINIAFVNPDSDGNMKCSIPDKELKKRLIITRSKLSQPSAEAEATGTIRT